MKKVYPFSSIPYYNSKIFLLVTAILLLITDQEVLSQAGWIQQSSPISTDIVSVSFINGQTGFAVGGNKILKTVNGGSSWFLFDSAFVSDTYVKIKFLDQYRGFISFNSYGTFKTNNGGLNWYLCDEFIYSNKFGFVDDSYGWIFGQNYMLITSNKGDSWYGGGNYPYRTPFDGAMGSRNFGVAVGYFDDFMHSKMYMYIWKTNNGGSSWECVSGNVYGDPCAYYVIYQFMPPPAFSKTYVVDDYTAFLYGGSQDFRTDNSGTSWGYTSISSSIGGFDFLNHNTGYAACGSGLFKYTTNSGASWIDQQSGVSAQLNSVDMVDPLTGWAVGSGGTILKTTTGGLVLPLEPVLTSPANNSTGIQLTGLLDWYDNLTASKYHLLISTDNSFINVIYDNDNLTESQLSVPGGLLTYNTDYYWKVSAFNAEGWGPFSSAWTFRTFFMPAPVTLLYPSNNSVEIPTNLTFSWNKGTETLAGKLKGNEDLFSTHPDLIKSKMEPDAVNKYWYELASDTVVLTGLIRDTTLTDTLKYISGLSIAKNYYWRVKAGNELGWGAFGSWWKFTTVIGPPQVPVLSQPQDKSVQPFSNLTFRWFKSVEITSKPDFKDSKYGTDDIQYYWFELCEDTLSFAGLIKDSTLTDTLKTLNLNSESKTYFWRVKSRNQIGWSTFSGWFSLISIPAVLKWELAAANIADGASISFPVSLTGYIVTNSGNTYRTNDGGSNWTFVSQAIYMNANSVVFSDVQNGYIAAGPYVFQNYPTWSTGDGGVFWNPVAYTNYAGSNMRAVGLTPQGIVYAGSLTTFGNPQHTYSAIIGLSADPLLYHTIPLNRVRGGKNNAWIVGAQGLVYRSLSALNVGENVNLTGISFNDDNTGYACGENKLFKSTNNGSSWYRLYPLSDAANYYDVYFTGKDTGWVACSQAGSGIILGTYNGGNNWFVDYSGNYSGSEFSVVNNKYGYLLCGNSVLRTANVRTLLISSPVLLSPANGASGQPLTPLLDWQDVTGAVNYRVQLATDTGFSSIISDDSTLTNSEYLVSSGLLQNFTFYYWRVAAKNSDSWSVFSDHWSFRTYGSPNSVTLNYPPNNASGISTSLTFNWFTALPSKKIDRKTASKISNLINDAAGTNTIGNYWFELTRDTVNLTDLVTDSLLTDTSKSVSGLIFSNSYYWRVKAKNEAGWGAFSSWWKFNTTNGVPVLISPVNNKTEEFVTPYIDWGDVAGGVKYRLQVSAMSNFSVLWLDDSNLTASEYNVPSGILAYNSLYYWRVKSKNSAGWSNFQVSPFRFFTQIIPPPPVPVLVSPLNNSTGNPPAVLLEWNDASGAVKYNLIVSADSGFSNIIINDSSVVTSSYQVIQGLLDIGSRYYWKVSAKNNNSWSRFSNVWNFKTSGIPLQVVLSFPPDNSVEQPLNLTFSWFNAYESLNKTKSLNSSSKILNNFQLKNTAVKNRDNSYSIDRYWFELSNDTNVISSIIDSLLTDTLKPVTGLNIFTKYYWRVKARNENGWGSFSNWWSFTTTNNQPPAAPVLVTPVNNASDIPVTPLLVWNAVSGASGYRLQVSAFSSFSTLWVDDSNITAAQYNIKNGVLAYNSLYYWRVKAKNSAGWGNYQSAPFRFFTMIIPPPAVPVLASPVNGATGISLTPLLDWNDVSGAVKYRLIVSSDSGFTNIIVNDSTLITSQYSIPAGLLVNSTVYYWKVAAKNSLYWGSTSEKFSFRTFGNPQTVVLLSPANKSIEQPLNITFTWMKALESLRKIGFDSSPKHAFTGNVIFSEKSGTDAISRYWFEIVTDTVSMAGLISDTVLTDTVKSLTGLNAAANYYWRVKAFNEAGWGLFSAWWKFTTISGLPPAPPVLVYPANRAADIPVTPLLNWNDAPGAQKYYLQVSAFSNFSVFWINDSNITLSEYQVPNGVLAYNSGYFWRVKAKNDAGWGNFQVTPFRFFTLVTPPQSPPALVSPANGSVNVPLTPQLDWSDIASALKYRVQVSAGSTFVNTVIDDSSLTESQHIIAPGLLSYNTGYYWRVSVKTGTSWSAFSTAWSFTTVIALNSPALQLPLNKDTGITVTTLFKWAGVAGATGYRLQVSAFSNFSVLWIDKYVTDTLYQTPNGVLAYNSRYFWKVKSLRTGDSSSFSNPYYFFTKIFPYSDGIPEFESTRILDLTELISTGSKASYSVEFCKDTLFNDVVFKLDKVKSDKAELDLGSFDEYSTYFWRVCREGDKPEYSGIRVLATYLTKQSQLMSLRSNSVIPEKYSLYQNYPNPFNPVCRIKFDIPENSKSKTESVRLVIYDLIGREIAVLVNDDLEPGTYEINWNAIEMPSGIYIYQMRTASFTDTKKMVLLK
ncbi:MAG TPA: T9SS type A sorting domain-containing protein [Ignavibacteria bacterium]|nr:T9SS type A sorting domain-containing protein [Ignavibacteria bacterium]